MKLRPGIVDSPAPSYQAARAARPKASSTGSGLEFPKDGVDLARNERPVILLHGTLVEKEGIAAYRDFALENGHSVNHRTYTSISKGERLEKSADLASKEINRARMEIAGRNLQRLEGADSSALQEFFQVDANLYGRHDADAATVSKVLPSLLADVGTLLEQPRKGLEDTFSGKIKVLQGDLRAKLEAGGVSADKSAKMAAELVDSLAPKAIVVGHSAGGYVGYALTVNPETTPDNDPFTYDGGNGVGEMLVLSSPIGAGLPNPAPPGILDLNFYNVDKSLLRPVEKLPMTQLAMMNPFFSLAYNSMKSMTKQAFHAANHVALGLSSPLIHLARPGNAQVEEGSEFFNSYLKDKKVPNDVSVIAVTSPLDMLCEEDRSRVDASQPNAHNFSADLQVSDADIARERPTWAHVLMAEKPDAFKEQYARSLRDPQTLSKVLHPSNDDGVRYEALQMLGDQLKADPTLWTSEMKASLGAVAAEQAPFRDSPSYLAYQLSQA